MWFARNSCLLYFKNTPSILHLSPSPQPPDPSHYHFPLELLQQPPTWSPCFCPCSSKIYFQYISQSDNFKTRRIMSKSSKGSPVAQIKKPSQYFDELWDLATPKHSDLISYCWPPYSFWALQSPQMALPCQGLYPQYFLSQKSSCLPWHVLPGSSQRDLLFTVATFFFLPLSPPTPCAFSYFIFLHLMHKYSYLCGSIYTYRKMYVS